MKKENSHKYIIIGFIIAAIFIANGIISARTAQTQAPPGGTSNLNGLIVGGQKVSLADDTNRPTTMCRVDCMVGVLFNKIDLEAVAVPLYRLLHAPEPHKILARVLLDLRV